MGKVRAALSAVLFVFACGGPTKTGGHNPIKTEATNKAYQPLTIKEDAKSPNQAVILGTDERNGSTVIKLPTGHAKSMVDAMFVRMGGGVPASGGFTPVTLTTEPNADGTVQVGITEDMAGGTGSQWRAGVWVSAFVAATTLGKDLTDFAFNASSKGYIDGASASGLMAGGFLAAMTGEHVNDKVTMTGIINPDGTIGPVGGIPEKFKGSIEKGKKKLGFPIGMRYARSEATGEMVDLVQLAKDSGAEAVEIANVHEAYKLLTGKDLPEPVPVSEQDMALDDETSKAMDAKYTGWKERLATEWKTIIELGQAGRLPNSLIQIAKYAKENAEQAEKLHQQGLIAQAYTKMLDAWVYAASATETFEMLSKIQEGNVDGAMEQLKNLENLDQMTSDVLKKVGAIRPTTLGGHLLMISGFQEALRAWGFRVFAADQVNSTKRFLHGLQTVDRAQLGSPEVADHIVEEVLPAVVLIGRTVKASAHASEELEYEVEKTVNYMCSIPNVKRMSTSFASASAAGMNYFDTLLLFPLAQQAGIPEAQARNRIAQREPNYLVAYMMSHLQTWDGLPQELKKEWGETSLPWGLLSLAGTELAYYDSAALVAKYYSLGVHTNALGKADKVEHDKAFINMLASAERSARASARAARIATGGIPVQAKLAYQLAAVQREGDMSEKLEALASFWQSSAYSQTAVALARN